MSISNGVPANATNFNAAFLSRTQNSSTVGKITLSNGDSDSITDAQRELNAINSFVGNADNQSATVKPLWGSNEFGASGDSLFERVDNIDSRVSTLIDNQVVFGKLQSSPDLYFDDVTGSLGIGTNTPQSNLHIDGSFCISPEDNSVASGVVDATTSSYVRITSTDGSQLDTINFTGTERIILLANITLSTINIIEGGNINTSAETIEFKSGGLVMLAWDSDTGLWRIISGGGGATDASSDINYIENPDAEIDTFGWATYVDAAQSVPEDGTGGTADITFTRSTVDPLRGDASFLISKPGSANEQGEGVSYNFAIDRADARKVLTISFDYKQSTNFLFRSGTVTDPSDIAIYVYDVINAQIIYPSQSFLDGSGKFVSQFQTTNSALYRLIFHVTETNSLDWTLQLDNVRVGPSVIATGAVVSDWISFTPTGSWASNTTYNGRYRRVGDSAEISYGLTLTGAPTSTALTLNLPTGLTIDTTKLGGGTGNTTSGIATYVGRTWDGSTSVVEVVATYRNTTSVAIAYQNSTLAANVTQAAPFTYNSGDTLDVTFKVPISGWSSNVQVSSDYGSRVIAGRYVGATATLSGSYSKVTYTTVDSQTVSMYSSGVLTVPETGYYNVSGQLFVTGTAALNNITNGRLRNTTTSADVGQIQYVYGGAVTSPVGIPFLFSSVYMIAGHTYEIQYASNITTPSISASTVQNYLQVSKVQSPQTLAGSETVAFRGTNAAGTSITTSASVIPFTVERDTHNAWNGTSYAVPVSGWYNCSVSLTTAAVTLSTTQRFSGAIRLASSNRVTAGVSGSGGSNNYTIVASQTFYATTGQSIDMVALSGVNTSLFPASTDNMFSIHKVG